MLPAQTDGLAKESESITVAGLDHIFNREEIKSMSPDERKSILTLFELFIANPNIREIEIKRELNCFSVNVNEYLHDLRSAYEHLNIAKNYVSEMQGKFRRPREYEQWVVLQEALDCIQEVEADYQFSHIYNIQRPSPMQKELRFLDKRFIIEKKFDYDVLTTQLNEYLAEKHVGISFITDIFEHGLLNYLGYQFVPEKCRFEDEGNDLSIYLRTPHGIIANNFIKDLKNCVSQHPITIHKIDSNNAVINACIHLSIPYLWLGKHISEILKSIDKLLESKEKKTFYAYWGDYAERNEGVALTDRYLENLVHEIVEKYNNIYAKKFQFSALNSSAVWNVIMEKIGILGVTFSRIEIANDFTHYPEIRLFYTNNGVENEVIMTRDKIVGILEHLSHHDLIKLAILVQQINELPREKAEELLDNIPRSKLLDAFKYAYENALAAGQQLLQGPENPSRIVPGAPQFFSQYRNGNSNINSESEDESVNFTQRMEVDY